MAISLTGLSGFDSSSLISQLVAIAQQPVADLATKKSLVDSASSTMNTFSSRLGTLKANANALASTSGFSSVAAVSSDTAIVASVSSATTQGSYAVNVTQLAKAQKTRSDAQTSATAALGQEGNLTIKVGDNEIKTISVTKTDSLSSISTKIAQSGARVSAGLINAGGSYRLQIQGLDSGAANAVTFGETDSVDLGLTKPANLVEGAQDAKLTIDGLDVTRSTNSVSDAIPGVTLALTKTTTSPATVTLSNDSSALKSKISAFVSSYNDVIGASQTATGYGSTKASNKILQADPTMRGAATYLSRTVSGAVPGASGSFGSLAAVGVKLGTDGKMVFDTAALDTALQKDPESVRRLFVTDSNTGATGVMKTLADGINDMITGESSPIKTRIAALSAQSKSITASSEAKQKRVDAYEAQLKKQYAALDQAMSKYSAMSAQVGGMPTF